MNLKIREIELNWEAGTFTVDGLFDGQRVKDSFALGLKDMAPDDELSMAIAITFRVPYGALTFSGLDTVTRAQLGLDEPARVE